METLPFYIHGIFVLTVLFAISYFTKAARNGWVIVILMAWMVFTGIMAWSGFFAVTSTLPPRFLVAVLPPLVLLIVLGSTQRGSAWLAAFDLKTLTMLQVMRVPVELVLYWLYLYHLMPELMTFQGRNYDILSGITAPLVYYVAFVKNKWQRELLIGWNIVSLSLLCFTVTNGILSAPSPIQQFAFDQPNIAVLLFPFIWLPAVVVPIAYYSHIISIRRLLWKSQKTSSIPSSAQPHLN